MLRFAQPVEKEVMIKHFENIQLLIKDDSVSLEEAIFFCISKELSSAMKKFPDPVHSLAALSEEVGELNKVMLQYQYEPDKNVTMDDIVGEAIQVASMAVKIILYGDTTFTKFNGISNHRDVK